MGLVGQGGAENSLKHHNPTGYPRYGPSEAPRHGGKGGGHQEGWMVLQLGEGSGCPGLGLEEPRGPSPGGAGSGGRRGGRQLFAGAGGRISTAAGHVLVFWLFLRGSLSLPFEASN